MDSLSGLHRYEKGQETLRELHHTLFLKTVFNSCSEVLKLREDFFKDSIKENVSFKFKSEVPIS